MYVELNLSESLGSATVDGQVRKLNLAAGKLASVVCFVHYYLVTLEEPSTLLHQRFQQMCTYG